MIIIPIDGAYVENFDFQGSIVPATSDDIKQWIGIAITSFGRYTGKIGERRYIPFYCKTKLWEALVIPIAIYASEKATNALWHHK